MSLPPTAELLTLEDVPVSLSLDTHTVRSKVGDGMAFLALSHTHIEHRLYEAMYAETIGASRHSGSFSIRRLLSLSGLRSYGSVKRGCAGLIQKRSIETVAQEQSTRGFQYRVFSPEEIFARRVDAGIAPYPPEIRCYHGSQVFGRLMHQVVRRGDLTRREVLVVLGCAEGLSNAEIGARMGISEQTVKSHLRVIFDKLGVKRRTELVSRLLTLRSGRRKNGNSRAPGLKDGAALKNSVA
jgi:DNA-binding CsgD family transcriptional regulator